jgi:hypothetical protein
LIAVVPSAVRRHPVRTAWLLAQLSVVAFGEWATRLGGADYHIGFLLLPIMALLLTPGIAVPMAAFWVFFTLAEFVLGRPYFASNRVAAIFTAITWASGAYLTDRFWRCVLGRWRASSPSTTTSASPLA